MTILKVRRLWPALQMGRAATVQAAAPATSPDDGLDAFGSESDPAPKVRIATPSPAPKRPNSSPQIPQIPKWLPIAARWAIVVLLTAAGAASGVFFYQKRLAASARTGTLTVETTPSGLDVVLQGKSLGRTPVTTSLGVGTYDIQVGTAPNTRTITVDVVAGTSTVQRIELAQPAGPVPVATGGLRVQTEPSRLPVSVDGTSRGSSPVAVDDLKPGEHEISVRTSSGTVRRTVTIAPREIFSLVISSTAPPPTPGVAAGWLTVASAVPVQLREGGKLIGTSESDRIMLTAGDHDIEFSNLPLGVTARRKISVAAGKTIATKIDVPNGTMNINAQPWAEVFVDGERVGETPIGNLTRPVGTHEVLFRHPDLGERRETVVVAVGKPARIGVDLRKK